MATEAVTGDGGGDLWSATWSLDGAIVLAGVFSLS